jgi:site-specific recombinase XerD
MTYLKLPSTIASRQMNLLFDAKRSEGMSSTERDKAVLILAQILMQAAGLNVEELEDDKL